MMRKGAASELDELGSPMYSARMKFQWPRAPLSMTVVEYSGSSGVNADDRVLGDGGYLLPRDAPAVAAVFRSIEEAEAAARVIKNRREDSTLGVVPQWP